MIFFKQFFFLKCGYFETESYKCVGYKTWHKNSKKAAIDQILISNALGKLWMGYHHRSENGEGNRTAFHQERAKLLWRLLKFLHKLLHCLQAWDGVHHCLHPRNKEQEEPFINKNDNDRGDECFYESINGCGPTLGIFSANHWFPAFWTKGWQIADRVPRLTQHNVVRRFLWFRLFSQAPS